MNSKDDYRVSIARSRKEEEESRARRRQLRNNHQDELDAKRLVIARECFLSDVRLNIARRSAAEESIMATLRATAASWSQVCERGITRYLDVEKARENKSLRDAAYLEHTHLRGLQEQRSIEDSDQVRWKELNALHSARLLTERTEAVQDTFEKVIERAAVCLNVLEENHLHRTGAKLLSAFSVDSTLWERYCNGTPAAALRQAYHHMFNGSAYAQSSPDFVALLRFSYSQYRMCTQLKPASRMSPIPIFVLDGPKFCGKSLLADFLKSKYTLMCISDETLVQRALQAAAEAANDDNAGSWAALGHRVKATLLDGGAIDASLMTDLLHLQFMELREAQKDEEGRFYDAVLLEGVFSSIEVCKLFSQRLSNEPVHPYFALAQRWGLFSPAALDDAATATGAPARREVAMEALPPLLRIADTLSSDIDSAAKLEPKARPLKKVDLASLPPAELPEVEDTHTAEEAERRFIARAEEELATLPTVISGVLHIDCSPEEIFRRFAGFRVDCETGERYHLTDRPPPAERLPYVVSLGRSDVSSVKLHEAVFHHKETWTHTRRWFTQHAESPLFTRVYELNGEGPIEQVQKEALQAVEQIIANLRISQQLLRERDAAAARLEELEVKRQAQKAAREAERVRLADLYTEKGAPLPALLQTVADDVAGGGTKALSAEAVAVIFQALGDFTEYYEKEYSGAWCHTMELVQLFLRYYAMTEAQMVSYWKRPDDKQTILQRFRRCYNALPGTLHVQPACKAELHLSIDALYEALHRCITLRDTEARGLLETLCSPASFLGNWQTLVCQELARLLQAEVDRYALALHLFSFYLGAAAGEPISFDELEFDIPFLSANVVDRAAPPMSLTATDSQPSSSPGVKTAKEKRAATTKKGHKAAEEQSEKTAEEQLMEAAQGLLSSFSAVTEKIKIVVDTQAKGTKRGGGGGGGGGGGAGLGVNTGGSNNPSMSSSFFSVIASKCYGLMEGERAAASLRITAIQNFGRTLLREADAHAKQMRARMEEDLVNVMAQEAAAANTAVYVLRGCVEAEKKAPPMHLGCTTFAVLPGKTCGISCNDGPTDDTSATVAKAPTQGERQRSFMTDIPLLALLTDPQLTLHPGLTVMRLLELVQHFRCVAPDYQLSRFDFMLLLEEADYTAAAEVGLDTEHLAVKTREEVFTTFDPQHTDFIDWRDLVIHLLFWVSPMFTPRAVVDGSEMSHRIDGVSLDRLRTARDNLGVGALTKEQFFDSPFFFDSYLDDTLLEAYTRILWSTFHDAETHTIELYVLFGFLCADPQPIRGVQKAFYVLSSPTAGGQVTFDEMDRMFHLKATNARQMDQPDPCSKLHLRLLFGNANRCSFEDVCASPMGRKMLNQADLFRRRQFIKRKLA